MSNSEKTMGQVWSDYQQEAREYRVKEYGYDVLNDNPDYLLTQAMQLLARQPRSIFVGQGVVYGGHAMARHLEGIPKEQRLEFPVCEDLQLGFCTGLVMKGWLPIALFPRMDFMLRAMDQLVNHLDLIEEMSQGQWKPRVIIRTRVGGKTPLDAGPQHTKDLTEAFDLMLKQVAVVRISRPQEVMSVYQEAIERLSKASTIIVENLG